MKSFKRILEASYTGNLGFEELVKFYRQATKEQELQMDKIIEKGDKKAAWKLTKKILGIELKEEC